MVIVAVLDTAPSVAVTVSVVAKAPFAAFTVNVADVRPAAILTVVGNVASDGLPESVITRPPVGATLLMVTVPLVEPPGLMVTGLNFSETRVGGVIVKVAVSDAEPAVAVMVAEV